MNVWKAAKAGKLDWIEKHVESSPNLDVTNKSGETPLMIALKEQHEEIVQLLLAKGANPNKGDTKAGHSPLLLAVIESCSEDIVTALLEHNADVSFQDSDGCTALHWAVRSEQEALVRLLLARGADPNARTKEGYTPLHYASTQNIARELLAHGADKDALNGRRQTPVFAAISADNADVVRELVTSGCDLNVQTEEGETVLHLLAGGEDTTNMLQFVLAHNPNLGIQMNGKTPLDVARACGNNAIAQLLAKHGASGDSEETIVREATPEPAQGSETAGQEATPAEGEKSAEKARRRIPARRSEDDSEVSEFLVEAGLDTHVPRFRRSKLVNLDDLEGVDDKQLKKMNITAGEREKILAELAKLAPVLAARREAREQEREQAAMQKQTKGAPLMIWAAAGAVLLLSLVLFYTLVV